MKQLRFQFDLSKLANVIAFFAQDIPDLDKLRIAKLLYYADKLHLQRYARPIIGDVYYRLRVGPVPSKALDFVECALGEDHPEKTPGAREIWIFVDVKRDGEYPHFVAKREPDWDSFSASELEVLEEVKERYGFLDVGKLLDEIHDEAASTQVKSGEIDYRLLLEDMPKEKRDNLLRVLEHDQAEALPTSLDPYQ